MKTSKVYLLATLSFFVSCNKSEVQSSQESSPVNSKSVESHTPCVPPVPGLISWWPGEGNPNDIVDNNNGEDVNPQFTWTYTPGMVGLAFDFGVGNSVIPSIRIPYAANQEPPFITMETWVKAVGPFGAEYHRQQFIAKAFGIGPASDFQNTYTLGMVANTGELIMELFTTDGDNDIIAAGTSIFDNQFHHVAGTYDGANAKIYLDGALVKTASITGNIRYNLQFPQELILGGVVAVGTAEFIGLLDEPAIYNRALTAAEIQGIYNAGSAGKCKSKMIDIDILPGVEPNVINCVKSNGVITVAILTSTNFDAATLDQLSVRFGHAGSEAAIYKSKNKKYIRDVDNDGDLDMVVDFLFGSTGLDCSDTQATLTGIANGVEVQGRGAIVAGTQ